MEGLFQNECGSSKQRQRLRCFCATVLQVSGTRAAVQLRPAGYAQAEEANVQRTLSLQAHSVTRRPPAISTCSFNKMEGQWYDKTEGKGSKRLTGKENKNYFSQHPEKWLLSSVVGDVIVSLFVSLCFPLSPPFDKCFNFHVMVIPLWLTEAKTSFRFGNVLIFHPIVDHRCSIKKISIAYSPDINGWSPTWLLLSLLGGGQNELNQSV